MQLFEDRLDEGLRWPRVRHYFCAPCIENNSITGATQGLECTGRGSAEGGQGAHIQAQQLEDVLGDDAVALALQRAGLQKGVDVVVPRQPGRLLLLAQQPQVLCTGPDTSKSVSEPLYHASMACIIPP